MKLVGFRSTETLIEYGPNNARTMVQVKVSEPQMLVDRRLTVVKIRI